MKEEAVYYFEGFASPVNVTFWHYPGTSITIMKFGNREELLGRLRFFQLCEDKRKEPKNTSVQRAKRAGIAPQSLGSHGLHVIGGPAHETYEAGREDLTLAGVIPK